MPAPPPGPHPPPLEVNGGGPPRDFRPGQTVKLSPSGKRKMAGIPGYTAWRGTIRYIDAQGHIWLADRLPQTFIVRLYTPRDIGYDPNLRLRVPPTLVKPA